MVVIMRLKGVSPVLSRSYEDKSTGSEVTIHWVEMKFSDGFDTLIGELIVPKTRDEGGALVARQPEFEVDALYKVFFNIDGASGLTEDGRRWSRNRIKLNAVVRL